MKPKRASKTLSTSPRPLAPGCRYFLILITIFSFSLALFSRPADATGNFSGFANEMAFQSPGQNQERNARQIFEELDRRRSSSRYETSKMTMVIHNARGRTRTRELRTWSVNRDEVTKQLVFFESPADVRNTGLLTITEGGTESQTIYLPAVGRAQTIGSSQRSDRFMGSDFTYEDLGQQNPELYDFEIISQNDDTILMEAVPRRESQYEKIHFYIRQENYVLSKAEYFNRSGTIFKRLELASHEILDDGSWRPGHMVMFDLESDTKTELFWDERTINEPVPDGFFTERQLRRGMPR